MLTIIPLEAFADNYIWVLELERGECAVVDPGEHEPVLDYLNRTGRTLTHILLTHHHLDHVGGVPRLLEHYPALVYGPEDSRVPRGCMFVRQGDKIRIQQNEFTVHEIPAHTNSHIAFHGAGCLFSGDTLFSVGCGKLFEGTAQDMQSSLDKLAALPPETLVYCGHEYTCSNCKFALCVEPDNLDLQRRNVQAKELRAGGHPTLPSSIGEELLTNPFMRTRTPAVIAAAQSQQADVSTPHEVLGAIREWKDRF